MENNIKQDLCQELNRLLEEKEGLAALPTATRRDYIRLDARINEIYGILSTIARSNGDH